MEALRSFAEKCCIHSINPDGNSVRRSTKRNEIVPGHRAVSDKAPSPGHQTPSKPTTQPGIGMPFAVDSARPDEITRPSEKRPQPETDGRHGEAGDDHQCA